MEKLNESSYIKQLSRLLRTIEEAYDDYEHDTKKVAAVKADMDSLRRKVDEL
jgi:hypothetical protein